mgnify:CR=1 FL=1
MNMKAWARNNLGMGWIRGIVRVGIFCSMGLILCKNTWADDVQAGETNQRYFRYGFTVQNETGQLVPLAELWVCAPLKDTSFQHLLALKASQPVEQMNDRLGNHLLHFVFSNIPPYAVRIVNVEATVAMNSTARSVSISRDQYLHPEPLMQFDAAEFDHLAPKFAREAPVEQTVQAIFNWVRQNIRDIGYDGTDRGALYALTEKKGDCTEFAALFVALCRREGIPARVMGGYVIDQNTNLDPASFHNWGEYYASGAWHLADPQAGILNEKSEQYIAMRVSGESDSPLENYARFRYLGNGIKVVMSK